MNIEDRLTDAEYDHLIRCRIVDALISVVAKDRKLTHEELRVLLKLRDD